jgi:hypothetical protein
MLQNAMWLRRLCGDRKKIVQREFPAMTTRNTMRNNENGKFASEAGRDMRVVNTVNIGKCGSNRTNCSCRDQSTPL